MYVSHDLTHLAWVTRKIIPMGSFTNLANRIPVWPFSIFLLLVWMQLHLAHPLYASISPPVAPLVTNTSAYERRQVRQAAYDEKPQSTISLRYHRRSLGLTRAALQSTERYLINVFAKVNRIANGLGHTRNLTLQATTGIKRVPSGGSGRESFKMDFSDHRLEVDPKVDSSTLFATAVLASAPQHAEPIATRVMPLMYAFILLTLTLGIKQIILGNRRIKSFRAIIVAMRAIESYGARFMNIVHEPVAMIDKANTRKRINTGPQGSSIRLTSYLFFKRGFYFQRDIDRTKIGPTMVEAQKPVTSFKRGLIGQNAPAIANNEDQVETVQNPPATHRLTDEYLSQFTNDRATDKNEHSPSLPNYRNQPWSLNMENSLAHTLNRMSDLTTHNIILDHQQGCWVTRHDDASWAHSSCNQTAYYRLVKDAHGQGFLSSYYKLKAYRIKRKNGLRADVTQMQKKLEIERLNSAAKFLTLVEQMGAMPYLANLDSCGTPFYISKKFEIMMGFTSDQWCSNPELRIRQIHPDDRSSVLIAIEEALSTQGTLSLDYRLLTNDGQIRWIHDEARVILNAEGIPLFMQGVVLDISECKQAQEELERSHTELQKLIGALDALREKEQKRLAQEMHDDLGQLLAAMKIDLSTLQKRLPPNAPHLSEQMETLNELVDTMVSSVRRIIADLPPKIMEDRGLFNALALLAANFEKRHGISARLESPQSEPKLDDRITTPIYRIVQEALNNAAKHADAKNVAIRIGCFDHYLLLGVSDDGRGMAISEMHKSGSFGLISMRERVNALGGEMKIDSNVGKGTSIQIVIPLAANDKE